MKKKSRIIGLLVFCMLVASVAYATTWHNLTQSQRNQAIVAQANGWNNGSYGGQCKAWAQTVVWNASSTVWLPTNSSNYCYWNNSSNVQGRSAMIEYANVGEIIQMDLKPAYGGGGPHTAIIIAKDANGVTLKESNWCYNNCETVGTRVLTYSQFYSQVDCYTIYTVL